MFEWADPSGDKDMKHVFFKFIFRWKYDEEGERVRQNSRIAMRGFHEVDRGRDKAAPAAHLKSERFVIALAAGDNLPLH